MDVARTILSQVVQPAVLAAADPARAVANAWDDNCDGSHIVIAFGKASAAMVREAMLRIASPRVRGFVITRPEDLDTVRDPRLTVVAADHPIPTQRNIDAANAMMVFCASIEPGARVLALVSGGGSAQLACPREPLVLADIAMLTSSLLRSGATIGEVNAVRKHCEQIKGGQLARSLIERGASAIDVLVLSDVLGDRLDVISSGPFAPDPSTFRDAIEVAHRRGIKMPHVLALLEKGQRGEIEDTPKPGDSIFGAVSHTIIGSNAVAVDAACRAIESHGVRVVQRRMKVEGEAAEVGRALAEATKSLGSGEAIVFGGETTVSVGSAIGVGGRNQELALAAAGVIAGQRGLAVLSLGTDGIDGPTPAAGAIVDGQTVERMRMAGVSFDIALREHDSHTALGASGDLICIGPTGTNVNDIMIGLRMST